MRRILHDGEQAEDAPVLGHVADAEPCQLVRRQVGDRPAREQHLALLGIDQAHDGLERGALADAVAAQQAHHLAFAHVERNAVQDMALAVIGVHVLDGDEGLDGCIRRAHVLR